MGVLLGGLTVVAAAAQAAAPAAPVPAPPAERTQPLFDLGMPLLLDDRYLGDITVRIQGDAISFDGARFVELVSPDLTPAALEALRARVVEGRLTPQSATTPDISVSFDTANQQIMVATALSARGRRIINFGSQIAIESRITEKPSSFSAYVSSVVSYEYQWEGFQAGDKGRRPIQGTIDVGGRLFGERGVAFLSRQSFNEEGAKKFIRDETQLIYDDVSKLLRVTAGDLRYRGAGFQDVPLLAGVTIERFFGLEPQRLFRPVGRTQFDLERPSTVDIRINGSVLQQILLRPGRYDLRDFPLAQGSNNIELLIRDDTGREQIIGSNNFFDFDLLQKGVSDFSLSAGVRSQFRPSGSIRYTNDVAASGFYRRGLSDTLTAGIDIQGDKIGATVGASVLWASPIGVFRIEGAGSNRKRFGSGAAAEIAYSNTGRFADNRWRWTLTASAQHVTANFATLDDLFPPTDGSPNRTTASSFDLNALVSGPRISFSAVGNYSIGRGLQPNITSAVAGVSYNVAPAITIGAFGRYINSGIGKDRGAVFQLTWRTGRNSSFRGSYDTSRREAELQYFKSAPRSVGNLSYDFGVRRSDETNDLDARANAFYTANRAELTLQHNINGDANLSGPRAQITRASAGTALVFAGGKFGLSRPIRDGFAIVDKHPSLKGKKMLVDPAETGPRATSDGLGPAVVPDLRPYDRAALYVDVLDLPPGYDLGTGQFALRPPLGAGYKLQVGSGASYTVIGQVTYPDGAPATLIGGEVKSLDTPDAPAIQAFTNRNGRLAASGIKPGKYRLTLFSTPPLIVDIEVKEGQNSLIDLGPLRIPTP